jgi:hypothetical protein
MAQLSAPRAVPNLPEGGPLRTASPADPDLNEPLPPSEEFASESFGVAQMRTPEGHALYLKGQISDRVFRVSLARDPAESRLWCLFVEQRASVGAVGGNFGAVIGPGRLTQFEALACLKELAEDPGAWLSDVRRARLLAWLRSRPIVEKKPLLPLRNG